MRLLPPRESLQAGLAWRLALLFAVATAAAVGLLLFQAFSSADALNDRELNVRAEELARHVSRGADGAPRLDLPPDLAAAYGSPAEIHLFAVRDAGGRLVAASHPHVGELMASKPVEAEQAGYFRLEEFGSGAQDYYALTTRLESAAGPVYVTVARASDLDEMVHSLLREFVSDVAWIVPLFLAVTIAIAVLAIRRGLRPIRKLSGMAAGITPGAMDVRLPETNLPSEISPLVTSFNRALDRLAQGFAMQRQFTANAAHELRTPLAIVTAGLDAFPGNGEVAKLRADMARMNRLVDQLLQVARLDAVALDVSSVVDLAAVATEVVGYMAPWTIAQGRSLGFVEPDATARVRGNRHAIEDALRNLVENAVTHAPPDSEVVVRAAGATLSVADRGPGVPPEDRERIFERFWRGRGSRGDGAGLGLAIVQEVMLAHGGDVRVEDNPDGTGAMFTLHFRRQA
jgi:two-component system, OmpR family, sensor histidine kinase TctE